MTREPGDLPAQSPTRWTGLSIRSGCSQRWHEPMRRPCGDNISHDF